jgi:uncharacterized integral membrane protein (TIGR00697 family)
MLNIKKGDLIIALYIFGVMVAELMGSKTFTVFSLGDLHLSSSVAIFVMPLLFTLTDVVVEVKGKKQARSMVFSGLIVVALLLLFSLLATHLPPSSRFASSEPAYDAVFGASARIAGASIIAFAVSELLDVIVFSKLRQTLHKKALWLRNNLSNFVSQFADSAVFLLLAFYAFDQSLGQNVSFLLGLLIPYWLLRCGLSVIETPFVYLGVWWLRGKARVYPNTPRAGRIV